jgi:hypothetical protein
LENKPRVEAGHINIFKKLYMTAMNIRKLSFSLFALCFCLTGVFAQQSDGGTKKPKNLEPKGEDPEWASGIKDNMLVVMEKLASFKAKPIEKLSAKEANTD